MATPKRLNFADTSMEKPDSTHAAEEEEPIKKTTTKKKKLTSPVTKRIWNEDDELAILKGLVDYRVKTRFDPNFDWDGFFNFVKSSINANVSKEQMFSKIRKLRRKFVLHMERINERKDPLFTRSTDSQAFGYSNMIWGQNDVDVSNGDDMEKTHQIENGNQKVEFKENGHVGNDDEPVNENGEEKRESLHRVVGVDKIDGKESHGDEDGDEFCAVIDAVETMMSHGLSDYQKKLQLEKLMNIGTGKRKELSDEWKELCAEEVKLNIKKVRFSAKVVDAASDGMK
ncbi:unnamed protein product [Thlaspi arvense]|uniref:Glabrous enhancer-binding protein-like DBD domain-containing protein n=1 Tax=Thlaspi arvense TaxID=13288 RepID=A0AAU9T5M3_THLAR|nr:unnamed protein product [Thlaspi arvense]